MRNINWVNKSEDGGRRSRIYERPQRKNRFRDKYLIQFQQEKQETYLGESFRQREVMICNQVSTVLKIIFRKHNLHMEAVVETGRSAD